MKDSTTKGSSKPVAQLDPRNQENKAKHIERVVDNNIPGERNRRRTMVDCPCRLCALALNPPNTFAKYKELGLDKIAQESKATIYGPTPFRYKGESTRKGD